MGPLAPASAPNVPHGHATFRVVLEQLAPSAEWSREQGGHVATPRVPARPDGARISERLDRDTRTALRLRAVAQDDGDELLRLMILAVLAKADRPLDAEELAERVATMLGVRLVPERRH